MSEINTIWLIILLPIIYTVFMSMLLDLVLSGINRILHVDLGKYLDVLFYPGVFMKKLLKSSVASMFDANLQAEPPSSCTVCGQDSKPLGTFALFAANYAAYLLFFVWAIMFMIADGMDAFLSSLGVRQMMLIWWWTAISLVARGYPSLKELIAPFNFLAERRPKLLVSLAVAALMAFLASVSWGWVLAVANYMVFTAFVLRSKLDEKAIPKTTNHGNEPLVADSNSCHDDVSTEENTSIEVLNKQDSGTAINRSEEKANALRYSDAVVLLERVEGLLSNIETRQPDTHQCSDEPSQAEAKFDEYLDQLRQEAIEQRLHSSGSETRHSMAVSRAANSSTVMPMVEERTLPPGSWVRTARLIQSARVPIECTADNQSSLTSSVDDTSEATNQTHTPQIPSPSSQTEQNMDDDPNEIDVFDGDEDVQHQAELMDRLTELECVLADHRESTTASKAAAVAANRRATRRRTKSHSISAGSIRSE